MNTNIENRMIETYIGNGQTVYNYPHKDNLVALLDIYMLEKYFDDHPNATIQIGAKTDWFFTGDSLTKKELEDVKKGLKRVLLSSIWDNFKFIDENNKEHDCTITVDKSLFNLSHLQGIHTIVKKLNIWFPDLYDLLINLQDKHDDKKLEELSINIKAVLNKFTEETNEHKN